MHEEEVLRKLREAFQEETRDRLVAITANLLELEKQDTSPTHRSLLDATFREFHSLKGAARAVGMSRIESLCQFLEGTFAALRGGEAKPDPSLFDSLHEAIKLIDLAHTTADDELSPEITKQISTVIKQLALPSAPGAEPQDRRVHLPQGMEDGEGELTMRVDTSTSVELERAGTASAKRASEEPPPPPESAPISTPSPPDTGTDAQRWRASPSETDTEMPDLSEAEPPLKEPVLPRVKQKKPRRTSPPPQRPGTTETIRLSIDKLSSLLLKSEEFVSLKLISAQRNTELRELHRAVARIRGHMSRTRAELEALRKELDNGSDPESWKRLLSMLGTCLEISQRGCDEVAKLERGWKALVHDSEQDHRAAGRMVDDLLEDMKQVLLLPLSDLFDLFPGMVRDISRKTGREASLEMEGGHVEIDRRILDQLKDPLTHLLRNAVDHGIEPPQQRKAAGKPPQGRILLRATQAEGNKVEIVVEDDGQGFAVDALRQSAAKLGLTTRENAEALDDEEVWRLAFRPEVSTSPMVTEISGRGLGLAIAQEHVEKIGGSLTLESQAGKGTTFRLLLPVTLTTFRGLIVEVAGARFILPSTQAAYVTRFAATQVRAVEGCATIKLNGRVLSLVDLAEVLEIGRKEKARDERTQITVVTLGTGDNQIAFRVDKVLGEQEVLVKPLGTQLRRVRNIAGATILGTGRTVPILRVSDLLKSATRSFSMVPPEAEEPALERRGSVLIVEDSITSRTLLTNILEGEGYTVTATVDGRDALAALKAGSYDIVVSDVEMPHLDGFELTACIREDEALSKTPVVLVTSLDSRKDREKGIEVGADAYLVKSSFDQSNLLEVVGRLM